VEQNLYPNSMKFTKLSFIVHLYNLKVHCCESDSKLEKLNFAEAIKIRARFEKSEYDFWTRIGTSHS